MSPPITILLCFTLAAGAALLPWRRWFPGPSPVWSKAIKHQLFGPALVTAIILLLGTLPTVFNRVAPPGLHDEVVNLFIAKTFLKLRLTNPTPPAWESLQTFHTVMVPSYAGKFPPAPGMALALGMLVNWPTLGAIGAVAVACGAVCWSIQTIVPRQWAIVGGLLAGIHPHVFAAWGQTYLAAGTSMLGGALLLGATLRIIRQKRWSNGIVFGIGLALLANSRPFEGLLLFILASIWILIQTFRQKNWMSVLKFGVAPAAAILLPVGMWMLYYNHRITGDALRMPYVEHAHQYMRAPLFFWQNENEPTQRLVGKLNLFHDTVEFDEFKRADSIRAYLAAMNRRIGLHPVGAVWQSIFIPWEWVLLLPLAFIGLWRTNFRSEASLMAGVLIASPLIQSFCTPYFRMHYFGPIAPCWFGLMTLGLCELSRRGGAFTTVVRATVAGIIVACAASLVFHFSADDPNPFATKRQEFVQHVNELPGKHLVFIRYKDGPQQIFEWVYNDPDPVTAKIVFAHWLDREHVEEVVNEFPNHHRWLLEVDEKEMLIRRKPEIAASQRAAAGS